MHGRVVWCIEYVIMDAEEFLERAEAERNERVYIAMIM